MTDADDGTHHDTSINEGLGTEEFGDPFESMPGMS